MIDSAVASPLSADRFVVGFGLFELTIVGKFLQPDGHRALGMVG